MAKLLIVGSVAYDSVETSAGKVDEALGGAATYSSVAASFYAAPAVVAVVGEDFQKEHLEFLAGRGIDLTGLQVRPGKTFRWAGRYHADLKGRDTLDTQLNVFADFQPTLPEPLKGIDCVFLANIHPGLQGQVLDQVRKARLVVCDTMDLWINTAQAELRGLLPRVDLLAINDEETRLLTGEPNLLAGARKLLRDGVRLGVIVKKGEHGSTLVTRDGLAIAPAYPVENVVDPTGAGDSFAGALSGYLASTGDFSMKNLRRALLHGSALASFTVEGFSLDRLRKIKREDVESRAHAIKDMLTFD